MLTIVYIAPVWNELLLNFHILLCPVDLSLHHTERVNKANDSEN